MAEFDRLAVKPGLPPMEAKLVDALPEGAGWQYEPKWDGFRCLVFRDGPEVALMSKSGRPLGRYFPEVIDSVLAMEADRVVLDGELVIPVGGALSFDALQLRLHPAESRVARLARETPAQLILFDLLFSKETSYMDAPLEVRRRSLEIIYAAEQHDDLLLSPCTTDRATAERWLEEVGAALDGVVAKRIDAPYQPGERAMLKIKAMRTADCVVGGFRYATNKREVGSLLLGLYDESGLLHHVGFTSTIAMADRAALTHRLEGLIEAPGFTGDSPGGPSRWSTERTGEWQPLRPELVGRVLVEVVVDLVGDVAGGVRLPLHGRRAPQVRRAPALLVVRVPLLRVVQVAEPPVA
ncbi:MAG TPA: ATP-dependent DNA ligase, partial [Allosphingosinicella sp.]|nr:ATP-dependent DNA ligase [Allosphingosinicella sp.]